ncbi:hypothetical protein ACLKA6_015450 [Drosophila palustris]
MLNRRALSRGKWDKRVEESWPWRWAWQVQTSWSASQMRSVYGLQRSWQSCHTTTTSCNWPVTQAEAAPELQPDRDVANLSCPTPPFTCCHPPFTRPVALNMHKSLANRRVTPIKSNWCNQ